MRRRRRLNKKTKIVKCPGSVSLPPDIVIETLKRIPLKDVTRCLLVSKLWKTIIRGQDFIRSFPFPSPRPYQMRMVIAVNGVHKFTGCHQWFFFLSSSSQVLSPLSPLSLTQCQIPSRRLCHVHYVNGLMSLGYGHQQIISNPSNGKCVYLPRVKSRKQIIQSYFGFDPVGFEYKVLSMSERLGDYTDVPSSEHQVMTVRGASGKASWRMIECNTPHCPKTNGVSINGVLYYGAFTGNDMMEWCIMRFNVRTEKLDLASTLNENVKSFRPKHPPCLINYQGKVALACETSLNIFDLWVMEDAEKWSNIRISTARWLSEDAGLRIKGTIHTGEIVFYHVNNTRRLYYFLYDQRMNRARRFVFDFGFEVQLATFWYEFLPEIFSVELFFGYVESAMLL